MAAKKARNVVASHAPAPLGEPLSWIAPDLRALARPVVELKLDPKNARKHPGANLAGIAASLRAHGQRKPIVVRQGVVIAGNGTLECAKTLGWTHLACTEYDGPEALVRAYALADNRSAELATWDDQVLAAALAEADGAGLLEATAFTREDMAPVEAIAVEEVGVAALQDRFSVVVTGPMPTQPSVLRELKAALSGLTGLSVQISTSHHGD